MYNSTLQLNWKMGHGMPLTTVANNVDGSNTITGQTIAKVGNIPTLTNVMSSMNRQTHTTNRKLNKKMSGKRSMANNLVGDKNVCNDSIIGNNLSRGSIKGDAMSTEKNGQKEFKECCKKESRRGQSGTSKSLCDFEFSRVR